MVRILIACGGTGGHLSPGIAIAQRLSELGHSGPIAISEKGVDGRLAADYGNLKFYPLPGSGFSLRPVPLMSFFWNGLRGFLRAWKLLNREKVDAVLAFGGFTSLWVGLAALLRRKPIYLHESNLRLGKAVRLLSPFARRVFLPLPLKARKRYGRSEKFLAAGCPLRRDFVPIERAEARRALNLPESGRLLLLVGGSQGARVLVHWMVERERELAAHGFHGICLTGPGGGELERSLRDKNGNRLIMRYLPFSGTMALLYSAADVAVCRAGAGTLAELVAVGLPNVLVPYPSSSGDHQLANGRAMEAAGASILLPQDRMGYLLANVLRLAEPERAKEMACALGRLRAETGNAAQLIIDTILEDLRHR
ncbi:MAG: UDP-N-acetylglucosamine--N-acetylmuramyl-(pentapeptide) pyrophosphoryl-undecaprenol N-acetylglucosamine transferase [Puniceicoccales bacterium]|nr:UDP-N-acetylglucosamine--N-acetylmuramyl-(pentapeptide) pyrophosphoryl-undecaprenol N-acetylglucosamine transferase [Puniceicoccales bacterium]